jgi:methyl-accepting chemotaxis protein
MKKLLQAGCLVVLIAGAIALMEVSLFFRDLRRALPNIQASADELGAAAQRAQTLIANSDHRLNDRGALLDRLDHSSRDIDATIREIHGATKDVHARLVERDGILDNANATIHDARINLVQASRAQTRYYEDEAPELTKLIQSARGTLDSANTLIADPAIKDALDNLAATSKNTEQTTEHLAAAAGDIEKKVHQITRPASMARTIAMGALDLAYKFAAIFK